MATTITSGVQYSGIWTMPQVNAAVAAGTWTGLLGPPSLFSWGVSTYGQLGLGNTTSYSSPKQVGAANTWAAMATAENFTIAVKSGGTLWAWGFNGNSVLGLNNTTYYSSPKQVGALTNWASISCNAVNTLAIKTDGTLWGWGNNNRGELGLGDTNVKRSSPVQVGALTNWAQVVVGADASAAVKTDGTLWTWGYNFNTGQLGLGDITTNTSSPQQVGALTNWAKVVFGKGHAIAVKTNGTLWAWGVGSAGQTGLNTTDVQSSPVQVGALTNWSSLGGGYNSASAVKTDGTLWVWGNNTSGQLGLGNTTNYSSPKQVGSLTTWSRVWSSGSFSGYGYALQTNKTLWSWGNNDSGQLGLGNTTNYSSPKQVGALTSWVTLPSNGCGEPSHGMAITRTLS